MISGVRIQRLQHIGLPVADLDVSKAFYEGLGFADVMSSTFTHNGGAGRVSMMRQAEVTLELYQMPEAELQAVRTRANGRIDHIAFDTEDIDLAFATLTAAGYTIDEPAPVFLAFWKSGCKYFNVIGPGGERLEFNQILSRAD